VLLARVRPPGGVWQGAETLSQVGPDPFLYSLAVGANGDAVAALSSTDFSAVVRPTGGSWSERLLVPVSGNQSWSQAPVDKFGRAVAVGLTSPPPPATPILQASYYVPDRPPVVTTGSAASMTLETATVSGSVDPNRLPTTYVFQYGATTGYGQETDVRDAGTDAGSLPVSADLAGLRAGTTYHYRVVAMNDAGTRFGADQTFDTVASPGSSSPSPISTPSAAVQQERDTAAPALALTAAQKQDVLDQDGVVLFGKCDEACTLTASGTVSAPVNTTRVLRFKRVSKTVPANTRVKLRLRLSRKSLRGIERALSRGKKLIARVVLRATDHSGNTRTVRRKITLSH
jgi:hypothetical protein